MIPVNTPHLGGNEATYLQECIETGWISSEGPFIERFESDLARYTGANMPSLYAMAPRLLMQP